MEMMKNGRDNRRVRVETKIGYAKLAGVELNAAGREE